LLANITIQIFQKFCPQITLQGLLRCSSPAQDVKIPLNSCIARVNLEGPFVLGDGVSDACELSQSVSSADSHSQVHLLQALSISALRVEPILEVLDKSNRFVAFRNDSVKLILGEETGDFVDINANVVESCGLSCHFKSLVVKLQSFLEITLFKQLIGFIFVLSKSYLVKFFLDNLKCLHSFTKLRLHNKYSIEVDLCLFIVLLRHVGFLSAHKKFDFQLVLTGERLCLVLESINDFNGSRAILDRLIVVILHHVDGANVGDGILIVWVFFERLLVLLQSTI